MGLRIIRKEVHSEIIKKQMIKSAAFMWNASHGVAAGDLDKIFEEKLMRSRHHLSTDLSAFKALDTLTHCLDPHLYPENSFDIDKILDLLDKPLDGR
jgi:hypothetical protein